MIDCCKCNCAEFLFMSVQNAVWRLFTFSRVFHELWIFALQSNYENSFHWFFYNLHNLDFECVQKLTRRREFLEFSLSIISTQLRCDASDVKILSSHCDNPNNSKVCLVSSPISHLYKKLTHFKTLLQFIKFRQNGKSYFFTWFLGKKVFDLNFFTVQQY